MVFDESDDMFKIGELNNLESIASQNWVKNNFEIGTGSNHNHDNIDILHVDRPILPLFENGVATYKCRKTNHPAGRKD